MIRFIASRLLSAIILLVCVSVASFFLVYAAGDPAIRIAGETATVADIEKVRVELGLDRPLLDQYRSWITDVLRGDLGNSLYFEQPVWSILVARFPYTLIIGACAILLAIVVGIPLGVAGARWEGKLPDQIISVLVVFAQAVPTFWLGLSLVILLSVTYPILPASGTDDWTGYILPVAVLGIHAMPELVRLTRSGMIAVLNSDYIRTARAMGITNLKIIFQYGLRNALLPVVGLASAQFGSLLAGSVIIESVFAIPGAGRLAWESVLRSDITTIQALILCFSSLYIFLTLAGDILNAILDPRLRDSR